MSADLIKKDEGEWKQWRYVVLPAIEELKQEVKNTRGDLEDFRVEVMKRLHELELKVSVQEAGAKNNWALLAAIGSGVLGVAGTIITSIIMKKMGM